MFGAFNIGDTVVCTVDHPDDNDTLMSGDVGEVVHVRDDCYDDDDIPDYRAYGVCWNREICGGHTLDHHCKDGYGWYMLERELDLVEDASKTMEAPELTDSDFMALFCSV